DRVCRVAVGYQSLEDEVAIVARNVEGVDAAWVDGVVRVVRATREHSDLRTGSSVRGAIDTAFVARSLGILRGQPPTTPGVARDAALTALSGRVRLREGVSRSTEEVILEIWDSVFTPRMESGDPGKGGAPTGATNSR
ncbi:MAG: MoxR family ATPase, partial [Actinomycetota bacterium]